MCNELPPIIPTHDTGAELDDLAERMTACNPFSEPPAWLQTLLAEGRQS